MEKTIVSYLDQNAELIREVLQEAAEESFSVCESGISEQEAISVVLTTNFKLKTIYHPQSYHFTTDVLHVLYTFECETYIVDYGDVINFLTSEQAKKFEESVLNNATELLQLETEEELEEFNELSREEKLREIEYYLDANCMVLEEFMEFDKSLHDEYLNSVYDSADFSFELEQAMDRMYENV